METVTGAQAPSRRSVLSGPAGVVAPLVVFAAATIGFAAWTGSWYQVWKALHVLLAIVWIGGALMIQLFALRILREDDSDRIAKFARDTEVIGMRTFAPSSLALIVLGFVLVHQGHWAYTFWVVFAIAIWAASFLSGILFIGPESGRIGKLIEERGGVDAEVRSRIERLVLTSRFELVLLALVGMDMVLKPGL